MIKEILTITVRGLISTGKTTQDSKAIAALLAGSGLGPRTEKANVN